jgi:riboflavin biosynthesis pyrimidine reductase
MKPYVICHMMSSLDGRLDVAAWAGGEDSATYKALTGEYQRIHDGYQADAWLAGTNTMEEFTGDAKARPAASTEGDTPPRPWHLADAQARRFAIAIDRKGRLHWEKPTADQGHIVVVLGASVPDAHLAELRDAGVSYLVMAGDDLDLAALLDDIGARLPIRKLLLEGGARMNGAFLKAGLVDEVSLLLCPAIDGRTGTSTIFEAGEDGVGQTRRMALIEAQPGAQGTVHMRYRIDG